MSRAECQKIRAEAGLPRSYHDPRCGAPNMVPIYDPDAGETASTAEVCIDQFEFPDIPCEYPVVQVRANEAAELCAAIGKRLCDAHEWEGACAGAVHDPSTEYDWSKDRMQGTFWHNHDREVVWSYGPKQNHPICGTSSDRTPDCPGGGWNKCGSNTYPTGAFPACKSIFGAYDFHGNAAEHMNLPLRPEELRMQNGGGMTEMKGSWFVFAKIKAHADDCRWRAPSWHETRVMNRNSHRNYHLGFRCCKDVE
jgi:formylglycine-generating enzyme required for sulfatase activity